MQLKRVVTANHYCWNIDEQRKIIVSRLPRLGINTVIILYSTIHVFYNIESEYYSEFSYHFQN